jgi:hypothetical protein
MNLLTVASEFSTEQKCIKHLSKLRWGGKPICPKCGEKKTSRRHLVSRNPKVKSQRRNIPVHHCNKCNKDFSIISGTIFEGTKLPLKAWMFMLCLCMNAKKSMSALQRGVEY